MQPTAGKEPPRATTRPERPRLRVSGARAITVLSLAALLLLTTAPSALSDLSVHDLLAVRRILDGPGTGYGCGPAPRDGGERRERDRRATPRPRRPVAPPSTAPGTPEPEATPEASSAATPEPSVDVEPTQEPTPRPEPQKTPKPQPEPTPRPTAEPKPTPNPSPDQEPTPRPTAEPEPEPTSGAGSDRAGGRAFAFLVGRSAKVARLPDAEPSPLVLGLAPVPLLERPPQQLPLADVPSSLPQPSPGAQSSPSPVPSPAATVTPAPRPKATAADHVDGVDVSHWNGLVPFEHVRGSGRRFAFIKATQGTSFVDDTFVRQAASARSASLVVGAYHFFDYRVGGAAQAEHLLDVIGPLGEVGGGLPPVIDLECFGPLGSADQAFVRRELRAFVDTVYRRTGRLPIIYTSAHMWDELTGGARTFGASPLWVACWGCREPYLPAGWDEWAFWQTGSVVIPGVGDRIGEDRFEGDEEALQKLVGSSSRVDLLRTATRHRRIGIDHSALDARDVRVSVAGGPWGRWTSASEPVRVLLPDADGRHEVRVQGRLRPGVRGPILSSMVRLDRQAPTIAWVRPMIALGPPLSGGYGLLARAEVEGLGRGDVRVATTCGSEVLDVPIVRTGGQTVDASHPAALPEVGATAKCTLVAVAADAAGNRARWQGQTTLRVIEPAGGTSSSGPPDLASLAGSASRAVSSPPVEAPPRPLAFDFSGQGVALVAQRGPGAGALGIRLDGHDVGIIDLWAEVDSEPAVVLSMDFPGTAETAHRLEVRTTGPAVASAGSAVVRFIVVTTADYDDPRWTAR